ncbi:MAG: exodeoxyribonuclease VII large subunit, partial [Bdellovibrionales bacterium]|nr:exodeoxyribonuclease VII large subunit [Bdellovibrionales bacterium]
MNEQYHYISITEVHTLINAVLKEGIPQVLFEGEISQLTQAASGHIYFTIKDERSQLSAVMWKGTSASLAFKPEPGMSVLCHG